MATLISANNRFIELSLDAVNNLDLCNDLVTLGLARNAEAGLKVRRITIYPSATADVIIVRDVSAAGPRIIALVNAIDNYDVISMTFFDDVGKPGRLMFPFISAAESTITTPANCFIVFEI